MGEVIIYDVLSTVPMHHSALLCAASAVKLWDTTDLWLSLDTPRECVSVLRGDPGERQ